MSNSFSTNPMVLDTFSSAIDAKSTLGMPSGARFRLNYIKWQTPTTAAHTAAITDGTIDIFSEECVTAKQSLIQYFYGARVDNIVIAVSGVGSGKIVIGLWDTI